MRDKKTARLVEVVVQDGKSGEFLDGSWNYDHMPRTPRGLHVVFSVKDGAKIHLTGAFQYGQSGRDAAGASNIMLLTVSKNDIEDDFEPGVPISYPWTVAGEDYLLTVSVEPVPAK